MSAPPNSSPALLNDDPNVRIMLKDLGNNALIPNQTNREFLTQVFAKQQHLATARELDPTDAVKALSYASHPTQLAAHTAITLGLSKLETQHFSDPVIVAKSLRENLPVAYDMLFAILSTYAYAGTLTGHSQLVAAAATTAPNGANANNVATHNVEDTIDLSE